MAKLLPVLGPACAQALSANLALAVPISALAKAVKVRVLVWVLTHIRLGSAARVSGCGAVRRKLGAESAPSVFWFVVWSAGFVHNGRQVFSGWVLGLISIRPRHLTNRSNRRVPLRGPPRLAQRYVAVSNRIGNGYRIPRILRCRIREA